MKKLLFSFILILLCILSVSAYAETEEFLYSFNSFSEEKAWHGCFFDKSLSFGDGYSAFVTNPFGEVKNNTVTHVLDYNDKIHLEEGKIYTLSGYVMNPLTDYSQTIRTNSNLAYSANTVIVTVSGADSEWDKFTTTFYAGKTGEFNLSIHFTQGNIDFGFFIDEISLREDSYTLAEIGATGVSEILIPTGSDTKVSFTPYIIASDSTQINILSDESVSSACSKATGVSYNERDFSLTVSPDATPGTMLTINFALNNHENVPVFYHKVVLTDNMIKNSSFDDGLSLWSSDSKLSLRESSGNSFAALPTNNYGDFGFYSTITYDTSQLLFEGELYVLRARVKTDLSTPASSIFAKNFAYCDGNTVFFNINDIPSGEWTDIFAAFVPEASGIYNISANLCSIYDCTIYIDDIRLCTEKPKPEYITLHAPGNIAIPDTQEVYPVSALLRDQMGNIIETDDIVINIEKSNNSIDFDKETNSITVYPDTISGIYTLTAYHSEITELTATLPVTVSFDFVGDGGFEEKIPNEWWIATSPYDCDFYIRNDGYSKRALINCSGDYFILLNNSYVSLKNNIPYVFNGNFSCAADCTVTVFLESLDSEIHPLAQFHLPKGTTLSEKIEPALFLAEESVSGRIFLYVQSDNAQSFSFYADNLSLKKAFIMAKNLHLSGSPSINNAVEAQFSFYNSVAQNSDTSSCIINWYIASDPYSTFTMLENVSKNIYFDTTFLNKYVYFEVIPVCPITGFSGETVRSHIFKITYEDNSSSSGKGAFTVPVLEHGKKSITFADMKKHWARDTVELLAYNNIIHGKTKTNFAPKDNITRAEFAKLICSAFSVSSDYDFSLFEDIRRSDWYYNYVCALNIEGIITGVTETSFSPKSSLRREDAVVILMRIYEKITGKKPDSGITSFDDDSNISAYARDTVYTAQKLGIVLGNNEGNFCPREYIRRDEAAVLLYRAIKTFSEVTNTK